MKKSTALKTILGISIAGILFSGYLSFFEIFRKTCPIGGCSNLLGLPVCVYGLVMYICVFMFAVMGINAKR